ncbi:MULTISPECIES: methionine ABC transporter permease [Actinosynnema]|uniref:Binding-protein-dependent transport systems inner membrane component n=3 Tax=Actinosynnema TaxID=40566 RepID=C6WJH8_ACTMD|nr:MULTISPECIES: methionine ABC transporter permease [Actinosynnema]AXX27971.1 Methionine ABC transporter permease protein [Actinosynnema pretiosum subsp. pretiosum]ACU34610.1 binding-protein-dependent transport systems inner membrane component [Actinosynnema mirum DSM 43827]ATE52419.1 ABC transporter permease [Actinosynnema pretiosum]MCP2095991.1 D-methionine transport system permease protein [Actinosynnema pretiosum]QUF07612.1 ABC transporter permease [Actinosynnema pretiosum subsp. pretiosu
MRKATPWSTVFDYLVTATGETLYMVAVSTLIATVLGVPVGVWLQLTAPGGLHPRPLLHKVLGFVVDLGRAMPFLVLLVLLTSLTRTLIGQSIGPTAAIVPLSVGAIPFVARLVQNVLSEVHVTIVEAAVTTGASTLRIVRSVLLRESLPALVNAIGVTAIALLGYSAMAGVLGGGGLGDLAVRLGYQRFDDRVLWSTVAVLAVVATVIQFGFNRLARGLDRRRHASI